MSVTQPASKLRVGLVFGGRSGEHEISLRSARSIFDAIDRDRFEVLLLGINRAGRWHVLSDVAFRLLTDRPLAALPDDGNEVILLPAPGSQQLVDPRQPTSAAWHIDVVFPILHGTYGEDGTIQGFLELADIPYVGAGVLGSAVGMDKDVQKRLLAAADVPVVPFVSVTHAEWHAGSATAHTRAAALGLPLFVKPANLGSSVGISKVKTIDALDNAVAAALQYDTKVLIEKGINGREIECAVLGNDTPAASLPGEICPDGEFYSYEAKYIDEHGTALLIPAPLTANETLAIQQLAVRAFRVLECQGMARVDCFLERDTGQLYVNEINTIPGFTSISMYPKLWEASGLPYRELISRLIDLAMERHAQRSRLKRTYTPVGAQEHITSTRG